MIDGIKLKIVSMVLAKQLQQHPLLKDHYEITTDSDTGLVKRYRTKYIGLIITLLHDKYITIEGSLHKYWTGGFNYTDFGYADMLQATERLCSLFIIDVSKIKIERIEIGINVNFKIPAAHFVQSLRCFDLMPFSYDQPIARKQHIGKHFKRTQYDVKCYCKMALPKAEDKHLIRFEVRFRKMELIKDLGIKTLNDLLCPDKFALLSKELIKYYNRIHLQEPTLDIKRISKRNERELLIYRCDAQFWSDLAGKITKQAIHQKRAKYKKLVLEYSPCSLKDQTLKLILSKITKLIPVDHLTT